MTKITELTPEQQADILPTFHKWRDEYSVQNDNVAAEKTIEQVYKRIGKKKPLVIFTKSPLAMCILSVIWPDFVRKLNSKLIDASLGASLGDSLGASLGASLDDSLRASLGDSLGASLRASLDDSLDASLRASLRASLDDSLGASLGDSLRASLDVRYWFWWWAGFGMVDFVLRHFGTKTSLNTKDALLWIDIGKHLTRFIPYENVCFVSEKPTKVVFNEQNVLSFDAGMAAEHADGWGVYCLQGVRFDEKLYKQIINKELSCAETLKIRDSDQRAIAISMLGKKELIAGLKAELVDSMMDEINTELYKVKNYPETGETEYFMWMKDWATNREFIEWIPQEVGKEHSAAWAQAAAYRVNGKPVFTKEEYLLIPRSNRG